MTEGGLEDLRLLDLSADGSFEQLIESVVAKLAPARTVAVELKAGILLPGGAAATGPFEALALIARANDHLHHHPRVAIVTVRNVGFVDVAVDAITLHHSVRIPASSNEVVTAMMGRNDYPDLNPHLPSRVVAGESLHWLSSFETLSMMAAGVAPAAIVSIYASVDLGSGERLESNRVSWTDVDLAC